MEITVKIILIFTAIYLIIGILIYFPLIKKGIITFDESMHETPLFFKILIFPGVVALWLPLVLKWKSSLKNSPKIH
jgi:uncharacterized membrane protein